jgi:hypothetical protein
MKNKTASVTIIAAVVITLATYSRANAQDAHGYHGEVYALASDFSGDAIPAAGFRIGGAWRPDPHLSLVGDVSHHFISDEQTSFTTMMAGLRVHKNRDTGASWYWQFMAGEQRFAVVNQRTHWNLILAPGVGGDLRISDHFTFRIVELEFPVTRQLVYMRISSGFAFRFGH